MGINTEKYGVGNTAVEIWKDDRMLGEYNKIDDTHYAWGAVNGDQLQSGIVQSPIRAAVNILSVDLDNQVIYETDTSEYEGQL